MYPGGKNAPGTFQTIINQIPPHRIYIEPFAGSAAIYHKKRLADFSILIERDPTAAAALMTAIDRDMSRYFFEHTIGDRPPTETPAVDVICADALKWLRSRKWRGDEFVYADPPYISTARKSGSRRRLYRHDITSNDQHNETLDVLAALPCAVMISGYWSELYGRRLEAWRLLRFQAMTRGGRASECLWMNYSEPVALHDYSYLGRDRRERQDIQRMKLRWVKKLEAMPRVKRQAILAAFKESGL